MDDLKPLFWMFVLDELVFLLFLSCNHSYPCPLFCVLLSFQKGPTLTISHPPSNLRPATPYACVDAIIEVSAANIVQQRSFIEVTQWKPQMNRCHMSCFLFCEVPCLDPLKKKKHQLYRSFRRNLPLFWWGGSGAVFFGFFWEEKTADPRCKSSTPFKQLGSTGRAFSCCTSNFDPCRQAWRPFLVWDPKHPWFANLTNQKKHHVLTETCGKSRERAQFCVFFWGERWLWLGWCNSHVTELVF